MEPPRKKQAKDTTTVQSESEQVCSNLRHCIKRWDLLPPYEEPNENEKWGRYYFERASLEFRRDNFFDDKGKELKQSPRCYGYGYECKRADVIDDRCENCGKVKSSVVEITEDLEAAWIKFVEGDECLRASLGTQEKECPPRMRPHCPESYAESNHQSGTTKGQYEDFLERMQDRVRVTLSSSKLTNADQIAKLAASGLYILSYWPSYEESGVDAQVRTVEFATRLYSPTGNGSSIDLLWYYHFRTRMTIAAEKYSTLYAFIRPLEEAARQSDSPTAIENRREEGPDSHNVLAILDGDTDEDHVHKTFVTLPRLRELRTALGKDYNELSPRKVFAILARASGAHIAGNEAGWVYSGMRNRYELYPGEESDGEEDGPEDGPGCTIC